MTAVEMIMQRVLESQLTFWERLQVSPLLLPKHGIGLKQGYSHSTLLKKEDMKDWTQSSSRMLLFTYKALANSRTPLSVIWLKLRLQNDRGNTILQLPVVYETESTTSCQYTTKQELPCTIYDQNWSSCQITKQECGSRNRHGCTCGWFK